MEYVYVYSKEGIVNYCQGQKVTPHKDSPVRVRKDRDVREKIDGGFYIETTLKTATKKDNNKSKGEK